MKKRYAYLIRPLQLFIDLIIINFVVYYIYDKEYLNLFFLGYINSFWLLSTFFIGFYKVFRHTSLFRIFKLLFIQFIVFFLGYFTYFSLFKEGVVVHNQFIILTSIITVISIAKFTYFYFLKKYRSQGFNLKNVIVLGYNESTYKIIQLFKRKKNLGYHFKGFFTNKVKKNNDYLGVIDESFEYILKNEIDEIYCSLSELSAQKIKEVTKFANENNKVIKLIPNADELYNKSLVTEFYDDKMLVLNVKKLPFESRENQIIKRVFDVFSSFFACVFVLLWLTPIIWLVIKLESKGPVLFKQKREGINGNQFVCYKFRSMKINDFSDEIHATKNDARITKVGGFLRKTSLDELPQFVNVLKGDMSVVGPRPHLKNLSLEYQKDVGNYIERHRVKPGITGLAQVSGYRGEIKKKADIKNRIRLDIFYIENWSLFLDIKIIFKTIFNVFNGEEKAY